MNLRRAGNGSRSYPLAAERVFVEQRAVLNESAFLRMLALERKRSERSEKPFLLMLLDMGDRTPAGDVDVLLQLIETLSLSTRETDVTGWYKDKQVIGVMFTEIGIDDRSTILSTILTRVSEKLRAQLTFEQFNHVSISFHVFPEEWTEGNGDRPSNPTLYPDLFSREDARKSLHVAKRVIDIFGSVLALIFLLPVFLFIAAAIRLTSKGPVFFRQRRVGQYGKSFVFLKFRSMYVNNDAKIHEDYVKKLIAGKAEKQANGKHQSGDGVYKLTRDPRVTPLGAFLRRTSLDELPQFINVLKGQMSLVGPRPPVKYEVEAYDIWHRSRLLEAKPGITGLWQVNGRSRVKFDDMVRLDLQYARTWSPWMDIKILFRTPAAALFGEGAH